MLNLPPQSDIKTTQNDPNGPKSAQNGPASTSPRLNNLHLRRGFRLAKVGEGKRSIALAKRALSTVVFLDLNFFYCVLSIRYCAYTVPARHYTIGYTYSATLMYPSPTVLF